MFATLSPGAIGVSAPNIEAAIQAALTGGFEGVELSGGEVANDPGFAREKLAEHGLRPGAIGLPVEFRKDEATFQAGLPELKRIAKPCAEAGITRCCTYILPFTDLSFEDEYRRHRDRLSECAKIMGDAGIAFGLEFVGPKTLRDIGPNGFLYDLPGMLELARDCGDNVGLLVDSFHWYTSGGDQAQLESLELKDIVYVHLNDAVPGRTADEQIDGDRRLPGDTGVIDLRTFIGTLKNLGYDGPAVVEPFLKSLGDLPSDQDRLELVAASLRKTLALA